MAQRATVGRATLRQVDHIAVAVRDAELAAAELTARFGLRRLTTETLSSPPVYLVHLDAGTVALQLVEPRGAGPVAEFLEAHGEGLHHICFAVPAIHAVLDQLAASNAQVFVGGGGRRACFLPEVGFGLVIELIEPMSLPGGSGQDAFDEPVPANGSAPYSGPLPANERRVIVIDDDPTGTQSVAGVRILLDANPDELLRFFLGNERATYVLTNSRALSESDAVKKVRSITAAVRDAAQTTTSEYQIVLRGDSTLRGHVFAELDAVDDGRSVIVFAPAYPEGGRTTIDGVHFAEVDGRRMPVAHTEYARDPIFGYATSDLEDWVRQRAPHRAVRLIPLATVRRGPQAVADAVGSLSPGTVAIPDAESSEDLRIIESGLRLVEARGVRILARTASTLAALRADLKTAQVQRIWPDEPGSVLVICGSHTAASTRQLEALATARGLVIEEVLRDPRQSQGRDLASRLVERLNRDGVAILATPRERLAADSSVEVGQRMMDRLGDVLDQASGHVDGIIAKGGITSATMAMVLGARSAMVIGQLEAGVPLWHLELSRAMPYAVAPGNIGDANLLTRLVDRFRQPNSGPRSRTIVQPDLR